MKRMTSSAGNSRMKKQKLLLFSVLLLILATIGGSTLAYLFVETDEVINTFTPSSVTGDIVEEFENNVKSDIKVQNTDDVPIYVRVRLLCYWEAADAEEITGKSAWSLPSGLTLGENWMAIGDHYYYTKPLKTNGSETTALFDESITLITDGTDGARQVLDILGQAIQAEPEDAVESVWPVEVGAEGVLKAKGGN